MMELITIPFSHYCEKARWALHACRVEFVERGHLPIFAYASIGKRSVPILVGDGVKLTDSTAIAEWADAQRPGTLLPTDAALRAEALALEDVCDTQLGPATRRWAYFQLLPRREAQELFTRGVPKWEALGFRATRPLAIRMLKRGLKLDAAGAERSRQKIEQVFTQVDALLADGRKFLVGDALSIADITFASLAGPILFPAEHPIEMPAIDLLAPDARAMVDAWRARPAGQHALSLYAQHRAA